MKKIILVCSTLFVFAAHAQIKVGSNPTSISTNANLEVESNTSSRFIVTKDSSKVGIGTLTPAAKLDVAGKVKITDGSQGNGKIFVSNALGVGSWVTPASALSGSVKDSTTASNGLTLNGKNVELGGSLSKSTILTTSASNTLAINGLQKGNTTDSILVFNPSTGILRSVSPTTIGAASEPWNNVATNIGANSNVQNIYQMGKVGVNTTSPGSTLSVNGSLGTNYNAITGNYTFSNDDYYVSYEGTSVAKLTLPTGSSSVCNCEGRTYILSNQTSYGLTLKPVSGEKISGADSLTIDANQTITVVNTNVVSGNTWKIISFGTSNKPAKTYQIYYSDANGKLNTPETITGTYFDLTKSDLLLEVPSGYASNKVVLRWDIWGDVYTTTAASGSLRFRVATKDANNVTTYTTTVMMTGWATATNSIMRFAAPPSIVLENVTPGKYTYTLQVVRDSDVGTISGVNLYGIAARGDVLVR